MGKEDAPREMAHQLAEMQKEIDALKANWKKTENFLAQFGKYYNTEGRGSFFIVDRFTQSGANGVGINPSQGLIEHFSLPMKLAPLAAGEKSEHPYWVPEIIPESIEKKEEIELFGKEPVASGADSKAHA